MEERLAREEIYMVYSPIFAYLGFLNALCPDDPDWSKITTLVYLLPHILKIVKKKSNLKPRNLRSRYRRRFPGTNRQTSHPFQPNAKPKNKDNYQLLSIKETSSTRCPH
jgi:hypothetical protein